MSDNGKSCGNSLKNSDNNNSCNDGNCTNPLASCLFSLPPKQFSLLSSLLGIILIDNLDLNQQNSLGNFIVSVGQSILTAAAQGQSRESSKNSQNDQIRQQLQMLKQQIFMIEQELND